MTRGVRRSPAPACLRLAAGSLVAALSLALLPTALLPASALAATRDDGGVPAVAADPASAAAVAYAPAANLPSAPSRSFRVARSVTHGTAVAAPQRTVPWAVSLWLEPKDTSGRTGTGDTRFLCSATAISATELVTAAHCTKEAGYLYVLAGASSFADRGPHLIPVAAVRAHSGYRASSGRDDIAMLRSLTPMHLRSYARLATPSIAKAARAGTRPLRIYGWGDTEDGTLTGRLRTTAVQQQQAAAAKTFGRDFLPTRMIAAGRHLPRSPRYAGGCSGDSGGPLVTTIGPTAYLVGVTDFGLESACDKGPTVFASVGDFTAWERQTRKALVGLAVTHSAALPVPLTAPHVAGTPALGALLQCLPGTWSANVPRGRAVTAWLRGSALISMGIDHVVTVEDAGAELTCIGQAKSAAGYRSAPATDVVRLPTLPTANGLPAIAGVAAGVLPPAGTVATCAGVVADAVSTTTYDWLASSTPDTVNATVLATGPAITLDQPTIDGLGGRFLVCRATTANVMGAATALASVAIPAPVAPTPPPADPAPAPAVAPAS